MATGDKLVNLDDLKIVKDYIDDEIKGLTEFNSYNLLYRLPGENRTHYKVSYLWNVPLGKVEISGTSTGSSFARLFADTEHLVEGLVPGKTYYFMVRNAVNATIRIGFYNSSSSSSYGGGIYNEDALVEIPSDAVGMFIRAQVASGVTANETIHYALLNTETNEELSEKISDINTLLYKDDPTNNVPEIFTYYKGISSMTSVLDMPVWSWIQGTGSVISALLPDFQFNLRPNMTYTVECRTLTNSTSIRLYRVYVPSSFDEFYVGYKRSDSATFSWRDAKNVEKEHEKYIDAAVDSDAPDMFVYTDFDGSSKYWQSDGSLSNSDREHSQKFKIIPGGKCYVSYVISQSCQGAWFDKYGNWIAPLLDTDLSDYSYKNPNCGSGAAGTYVVIKEFTAPANAYWLSLNMANSSNPYRSYLASKPIFPHAGTGNILVRKDDAAYQNKKNKKLCVIGPSTAMIDRRYISVLEQYLCGWQEYIAPWYSLCESYGYSGGTMGYSEIIASSDTFEYESIYHGIVIEETDVSNYDDYIIMADTNGIGKDGYSIGDWGTVPEAPSDVTTYMGGLRGIVEYILGQNPLANIYLMTLIGPKNYFSPTHNPYRNNIFDVNEKTRDMALKLHLHLIDLAANTGFTSTSNYNENDPTAGYTYDGTHYNQIGSEIVGKCVRKAIIGI